MYLVLYCLKRISKLMLGARLVIGWWSKSIDLIDWKHDPVSINLKTLLSDWVISGVYFLKTVEKPIVYFASLSFTSTWNELTGVKSLSGWSNRKNCIILWRKLSGFLHYYDILIKCFEQCGNSLKVEVILAFFASIFPFVNISVDPNVQFLSFVWLFDIRF